MLLADAGVWILGGMPTWSVNEVVRIRLEGISFFLMGFAACSFFVKLVWNYLQKDFDSLPRLSYAKAAGLTLLVGLLFMTILTMISGARELMTPGAWKKSGATYKLDDAGAAQKSAAGMKHRLWTLGVVLDKYAAGHDGRFPEHEFVKDIPSEAWEADGERRFIYMAGRVRAGGGNEAPLILAYGPGPENVRAKADEGGERPVLLTNLEIVALPEAEILRRLAAEAEAAHGR